VTFEAPDRLETDRVALERLVPGHADELVGLLLEPQIIEWLWPRPEPPTEADIREGLARQIEHWERHGFGMWLMRDRRTGVAIGRGGLQETPVHGAPEVEIGWAVAPDRWGQGLATELAFAAIGVAFGQLALPWLVAFARPDNLASRRVMDKAGFSYAGEIERAGLPHVLYRLHPPPPLLRSPRLHL
jgi:ribosomal-protein-alanine N-acetyltransferase